MHKAENGSIFILNNCPRFLIPPPLCISNGVLPSGLGFLLLLFFPKESSQESSNNALLLPFSPLIWEYKVMWRPLM